METGFPQRVTVSMRHVSRRRPNGGCGRTPPETQEGGTHLATTGTWSGELQQLPPVQRVSSWTGSPDRAKAEVCQRKVGMLHTVIKKDKKRTM